MISTAKPVHRLPLQPLTAVAVLRNVSKPELATATLARLVEVDPALTAMVLRMANSPLFGFNGRVSGARQATVLLGTKTVGALAVGGTASLVFGDEERPAHAGAWSHAVTVAAASAAAARAESTNAEEAFTAGLLHNASMFVQTPGELDERGDDACLAEQSAELLRSWNIPANLVRAVRMHRGPLDGVMEPTARAVVLGHALAAAIEGGPERATVRPAEAFAALGLTSGRAEDLLGSIRRDVDAVASFLEAEAA